ncbi:hypothetical protein LBMAG44_15370 [Gemmatimonadota bacterium]|nr:hypothetical protein LBMAG44_15370 [Gemmatimonadota bacterium]
MIARETRQRIVAADDSSVDAVAGLNDVRSGDFDVEEQLAESQWDERREMTDDGRCGFSI